MIYYLYFVGEWNRRKSALTVNPQVLCLFLRPGILLSYFRPLTSVGE